MTVPTTDDGRSLLKALGIDTDGVISASITMQAHEHPILDLRYFVTVENGRIIDEIKRYKLVPLEEDRSNSRQDSKPSRLSAASS